MHLIHPSQLWWASLLAVPILLHLFRRRPGTRRVSQLMFFQTLDKATQESPWLRRLKRLLAFLLTALVLAGLVGSLARVIVSPVGRRLKGLVILLDRSASMAAADGGPSRLEEGLATVRRRLGAVSPAVPVTVVAYDRRPQILCPRTLERREVLRHLDGLGVRPMEGDPAPALVLARRLARLDAPALIWHVSDAPPAAADAAEGEPPADAADADASPDTDAADADAPAAAATDTAAQVSVETILVPMAEPVNAGITALAMRPVPMQPAAWQAFIQVHAAGPTDVDADLEIRLDGRLTGLRKLTLTPGRAERLLLPVEPGKGRRLSLRLSAEGDVLPIDDRVDAFVPEPRPLRILWVARRHGPFTQLALGSLVEQGAVEVFQGDPDAWPSDQDVDVVIFENWLPASWPRDVPVLVIDPPHSLGPVQAVRLQEDGLGVESPRPAAPDHPVLYGVASPRISVTQTAVLKVEGPLEALWKGPAGPLLAAGEVRGRRLVVMAFSAEQSPRFPLLASYPLLIGNAVYWAARPEDEPDRARTRRTGDLVALEGRTLRWTLPGPDGKPRRAETDLEGRWTELDRVGLWETDVGERGSAALLARRETCLPAAAPDGPACGGGESARAAWSADLTAPLAWTVLVVLLVEAYLFHRKAVY